MSEDTLPEWLYYRFSTSPFPWEHLDDGDQLKWEHEAAAVRRAVARNGFKNEDTLAAARKAQLQQQTA